MEEYNKKISTLLKNHEKLFDGVKNSKENSIYLGGTFKMQEQKIDDEKLIVISESLKTNSSLKEIHLNNNQIGSEGIKYLSEALKINSSLKEIDLESNIVGDEGTKYLSESLKLNSSLNGIILNNNNIGEKGANCILDSLSFNYSLTKIKLDQNKKINENLKKKIYSIVKENQKNPERAKKRVEENLKKSKIVKFSSIVLVKK